MYQPSRKHYHVVAFHQDGRPWANEYTFNKVKDANSATRLLVRANSDPGQRYGVRPCTGEHC